MLKFTTLAPCSKAFLTKISLLFVIGLFCSCNAVKRIKEGESLLTKNTIYVNGKKEKKDAVKRLLLQQSNSSILGIPLRLHIYNFAKQHPDSAFYNWLYKKEKRKDRLKSILSEKQLIELQNIYSGINNWLKKTGETPIITDNTKISKSLSRLQLYYESKGYFNASASHKLFLQKQKKMEVNYYITTGMPYYIDSISSTITSKALDSIYLNHKKNTFIREGDQFDLINFNAERNRLNTLFLNSGIYQFQNNAISFTIKRDTLVANEDHKMPVEITIGNFIERGNNDTLIAVPYRVHRIKNVDIYIDCLAGQEGLQSKTYKNYTLYYKDKLRYKPVAIANTIAINPGDVYRDADRALTNRQISNLNTFTYPSINYNYADSTRALLATRIYMTSRPKFSLGFEGDLSHSNIQDFGISFSTSIISRNVFRGAETLEISARGTIGASKEANNADDVFFNISEIGADMKLNFPRFFVPFSTDNIIPKYMAPTTRISLGTTVQTNIGLDKQSFNGVLRYTWNPGTFTKNALEVFNIQFIRNVNIDNFFNVYQNTYRRLKNIAVANSVLSQGEDFTVPEETDQFINDVITSAISLPEEDRNEIRRIDERKSRLTDNNLIVASNFTYTRNNRKGITDNNFSQFRAKIEFAGTILSTLSGVLQLQKNENNKYELFKVAYSQYVKPEFDYIKYWSLSSHEILAFRSFIGVAIPYGNADNIPFSRSYFGGGSNDNRAWEAYALGPGSTLALNDFNEANLKLSFNLEYRFKIFGSFNGALFSDIGNIWNVLDDVEDEKASFSGLSSLKDVAVGTGFGIRYDFGFFVLRFDTGFKTYNPVYDNNRRWFTDYNFANAVYNIGINYPF